MERKWSQAVIGGGENKDKKQERKFDKWEIPARYKKKKITTTVVKHRNRLL